MDKQTTIRNDLIYYGNGATTSMAMKKLLPLQRIIKDTCKGLKLGDTLESSTKGELLEDSSGGLTLARLEPQCMTSRSKYYAIKYHWFREFLTSKNIRLIKIDTKIQLADIITESLGRNRFKVLRHLLVGWSIEKFLV